jgi:neutral ceramidase
LSGIKSLITKGPIDTEEYCFLQIQRYEGASTIYGPHTLSAYIQKFRGLAKAIAEVRTTYCTLYVPAPVTVNVLFQPTVFQLLLCSQGKEQELPKGPEPPFFKDSQLFSLLPAAAVDKKPINTTFGEVLERVDPEYTVVSLTWSKCYELMFKKNVFTTSILNLLSI